MGNSYFSMVNSLTHQASAALTLAWSRSKMSLFLKRTSLVPLARDSSVRDLS